MNFQERVRRRNEFDASIVYGTKKFNLITGRDKHAQHRDKSDDKWMDQKTGLICDDFAEKRICPLCKSNDFHTLFIKSGFPHVKCNNCGLVYVNPILNKEEYSKLWSAEDSWEKILENEHQVKMQALEANYSLDVAELYLKIKEGISICDVGCGPGTLLAEAKKRGYGVLGIEPNRKTHLLLEKKGINFVSDFFPLKKEIKERFDCIFVLNTLEHLHDPLLVVKEARKLLKRAGLIYISVPHTGALVSRIMHEKAGVFGGHSHIQFFSIKTLSELLDKAGFQVLEYETIITELGVIKNYLSFEDPYFGDSKDDYDYLPAELIYKNHLARNLNMVARVIDTDTI